jgi:hypothetical protein
MNILWRLPASPRGEREKLLKLSLLETPVLAVLFCYLSFTPL